MIENIPLFNLAEEETLTAEQIIAAVERGKNPFTGEEFAGYQHDELRDTWYSGYPDREHETPIGPIYVIRDWGGVGDGSPMGRVVKHVPTGRVFLMEGVYSSWDSNEWAPIVEAEEYTFTETRWRPTNGAN